MQSTGPDARPNTTQGNEIITKAANDSPSQEDPSEVEESQEPKMYADEADNDGMDKIDLNVSIFPLEQQNNTKGDFSRNNADITELSTGYRVDDSIMSAEGQRGWRQKTRAQMPLNHATNAQTSTFAS